MATPSRERQLVENVWQYRTVEEGGGGDGGSESVFSRALDIAFDTPGLRIQNFPITAVSQGSKTFTIAGDHASLFPAGYAVAVIESTGNDTGHSYLCVDATPPRIYTDATTQFKTPESDTGQGAVLLVIARPQ